MRNFNFLDVFHGGARPPGGPFDDRGDEQPVRRSGSTRAVARLSAGLLLLVGTISLGAAQPTAASDPRATVIVVVGAAGEEAYGDDFTAQAAAWEKACATAGARRIMIGRDEPSATSDLEQLKKTLAAESKEPGAGELWLVLIGHGTFDGKEAKFNLRGPDLAAAELAEWLKPFHRPLALIDTSSGSAPYLAKLSAPGRVIVTATRSGFELNYARLGRFLAEAVTDPASDLDQDGQTSLLEAFLSASARVAEFYKGEGRLVTEHALLDDNGDGLGTPAEWFRGVRAVKKAQEGKSVDGLRAHQFHLVRSATEQQFTPEARARRDELERTLADLREQKAKLGDEEYFRRLEVLLLELAGLYAPAKGT